MVLSRSGARRPHPKGGVRAARVAARRPRARRRPPPARGPRRLHGLRDVVPRRADRRPGAPGARGRAGASRGRPPRCRQPRGRHDAGARGGARVPGPVLAGDGEGGEPARRGCATRCSSSRPRWRSPTATRRATRPRSPRWPRCAARTSRGLPAAVERGARRGAVPGLRPRAHRHRRGRPRLGDRPGGGAQAARGRHLPAEAHHTEQILHGHLAAIDETVRVFVLEGEGRAAARAADVVRALGEIGAETTLVPTEHPAVDIVRFQLLTLRSRSAAASTRTRSAGTSRAGTRRAAVAPLGDGATCSRPPYCDRSQSPARV